MVKGLEFNLARTFFIDPRPEIIAGLITVLGKLSLFGTSPGVAHSFCPPATKHAFAIIDLAAVNDLPREAVDLLSAFAEDTTKVEIAPLHPGMEKALMNGIDGLDLSFQRRSYGAHRTINPVTGRRARHNACIALSVGVKVSPSVEALSRYTPEGAAARKAYKEAAVAKISDMARSFLLRLHRSDYHAFFRFCEKKQRRIERAAKALITDKTTRLQALGVPSRYDLRYTLADIDAVLPILVEVVDGNVAAATERLEEYRILLTPAGRSLRVRLVAKNRCQMYVSSY